MDDTKTLYAFDFDGLLANTNELISQYLPHIFAEYLDPEGKIEDFPAFRKRMLSSHGSTLHGWAALNGLPVEWIIQARRETSITLLQHVQPHLSPSPRLVQGLEQLQRKQSAHLVVITHGDRVFTLPLLAHIGLAHIFPPEHVYDFSSLNGRTKDDPETYRHVLQQVPFAGFQRMFMAEDTPANLPPAKAVGFGTLLVSPSPPPGHHAPSIDHHFPTTEEAVEFLNTADE